MLSRTLNRCWLVLSIAALTAALAGCSGAEPKEEAEERSGLSSLALLYGRYSGAHQGAGPPNEKAFKDYLKTRKDWLAPLGAENNLDSLFVSPRDGQPYVVVYGLKPGPSGSPSGRVIAYEREGVGGKRFVAFFETGAVQEMNETQFQAVVPKK